MAGRGDRGRTGPPRSGGRYGLLLLVLVGTYLLAAFSPTDVSAIRPWAKLMMMAEEAISLLVAILVVSRAVNILR